MLTTAKNMQLMDASGVNISPVTDITSLYYEVPKKINGGEDEIVVRQYVYSGFPVAANLDPTNKVELSPDNTTIYTPYDFPENSPKYYRLVDDDSEDIIVSNISTSLITGTTYRLFNITHYNLSLILSHYATRELFDASIHVLDVSLNIQDASITHLYNSITSMIIDINGDTITYVPNSFYLIKYYVDDDGIMDIPETETPNTAFSGPLKNDPITLLIRACDTSTLDYTLYDMYDSAGNSLSVRGKYTIVEYTDDNITKKKIRITYLKDKYGNEAPYDFYNLTYSDGNNLDREWIKFVYTFNYVGMASGIYANNNALLHNNFIDKIKNNIIKTNPFDTKELPVFAFSSDENTEILNNFIGYNNKIALYTINLNLCDNIIFNENNIKTQISSQTDPLFKYTENVALTKSLIGNENTIKFVIGGEHNNLVINNNNNLNFRIGNDGNNNIKSKNIIIGNNNVNITLYPNRDYSTLVENAIILNNCTNTSIYISNNIVFDTYSSMSGSFDTESNSAYLFNLNVYAASFNTLKLS